MLAAGVLALAGCGADDGAAPSESAAQDPLAQADTRVVTLQHAIERAMASGDCERINKLNPISRPDFRTPERCESLQRLDGLEPGGGASYGKKGAVLDYAKGERTINVVAILDADKRFHVALIDGFLGEPTVGTKLDRKFVGAAEETVAALRAGDCKGVLGIAYRRSGPGAGHDEAACLQLQQYPLSTILRLDPDAEPKLLGGNSAFAFFQIESADADTTMIMARQAEAPELPDGVGKLPKDAPRLGFAGAFDVSAGKGSGKG